MPSVVENAIFAWNLQAGGLTFGAAAGDVNCQIVNSEVGLKWGCAVLSWPTWTWEETSFAEYCAQLVEVGCRNGLVVTGDASPMPQRHTDVSFGGMESPHVLAPNERITVDAVSWTPEGDGVRCEDSASGHGFVLSAAALSSW